MSPIFAVKSRHNWIVVAKAAEQKQREDQMLIQYDDGNNWYGKDPILRLIHTLDKTEIRRAYMDLHDLSNEHITLDNAKSVEKREVTVWQKMVNVWNDENFAPYDNGIITSTINTFTFH